LPEEEKKAAEKAAKDEEEKKPAEAKEIGTKEGFYIDLRPRMIKLPSYKNKTKINVRYPLIPPFAFAHIFWDDKNKEYFWSLA